MKVHAAIADYETDIQIRDDGSHVIAAIDGRRYELSVRETVAGRYLLIADGQVFECRVEAKPESGKAINVVVGTTDYRVSLIDPRRLRGAASVASHGDDAARIIAPMPGRVVRVLVEVGAQVQVGAGIVTVEAMKMQNEMKSPKTGTVVALKVQTGATVNAGDVLAVIE